VLWYWCSDVVAQDMHNMNGRVNKLTHLVESQDKPKAPHAVDMVCVCEGSRETERDSCLCVCVCVYICMYICVRVHLCLCLN